MSKNEHLAKYEERKKKIISLLGDTGEYLRENDKTDDAESMFKLKVDVEKNLFSVVLIGEFSVGKSTFLNALMHRRMLPSFKKETTATVNFLRHTSQAPNGEAGIVYYRDGTTKILPNLSVDTIAKFVSTTGDTKERTIAQTVEKVDLFLESKFLEDGVMLVDSPGLNGITENLEAITRRQIKESHACIFMFSTDHPGTKTEFEILRDLRTECQSIFIVLNKIEEIKASEGETVESVTDHLKNNYMKQFPDAMLPEICPISAYSALAARDKSVPIERDADKVKDASYYSRLEEMSRLGNFEDRLFRYLTEGERTREQLSEPVNKVKNILQCERDDLDAHIKTLEESRSTDELEQQKLALEEGIANLQKERQTATKPVRERFQAAMRDFKNKIDARCSEICRRVESVAQETESLDDLKSFAAELPDTLQKQFLNLAQRLEDDLRDDLKLVVEESVDFFDGLQETLSNVSGGELKIYNRDMKLTETEVGKNMEAMEKAFAAKRREMEQIEEAISAAETSRAQVRKLERRKDDIQRQLKEIAGRRIAVLETFTIPDVEYRTRTVTKTKARGGFLGFFTGLLIGDKEYQDTEETRDSSAHDAAVEMYDKTLSAIDSERAELLKEMANYSNQSGTSEDFDAEIQRKSRQLEKLNEEYKADVKKYMASLDADAAKARKKILREIKEYIENFADENSQTIRKYLDGIERKMFDAVKAMLESRFNAEIERQQKKIDMLIEDSKASDAERDSKLQKATAAREFIAELLGRVAEVESELEEMSDVIEEA